MLLIEHDYQHDPSLNLALEEYVLRHVTSGEPILLFYINEPTAVIGRNQNSLAEIDSDYVKANEVHVVRRLSGGGAVYHDLGNLNFSFMTNGREDLHNFAKFTEPVVAALRKLGVPAELHGKSDIFVAGKKISGNAQYATTERLFSHGTILFDTNLEEMLKVLNPRQAKIESRAVQSIRNFVTNVRDHLPDSSLTIGDLREAILDEIFHHGRATHRRLLTSREWHGVRDLADKRYRSWNWTYGSAPKFNLQKKGQFGSLKLETMLLIEHGRIQMARIQGNFAGQKDIENLQDKLVGLKHDPEAITHLLENEDLPSYFGDVALADLLSVLY